MEQNRFGLSVNKGKRGMDDTRKKELRSSEKNKPYNFDKCGQDSLTFNKYLLEIQL